MASQAFSVPDLQIVVVVSSASLLILGCCVAVCCWIDANRRNRQKDKENSPVETESERLNAKEKARQRLHAGLSREPSRDVEQGTDPDFQLLTGFYATPVRRLDMFKGKGNNMQRAYQKVTAVGEKVRGDNLARSYGNLIGPTDATFQYPKPRIETASGGSSHRSHRSAEAKMQAREEMLRDDLAEKWQASQEELQPKAGGSLSPAVGRAHAPLVKFLRDEMNPVPEGVALPSQKRAASAQQTPPRDGGAQLSPEEMTIGRHEDSRPALSDDASQSSSSSCPSSPTGAEVGDLLDHIDFGGEGTSQKAKLRDAKFDALDAELCDAHDSPDVFSGGRTGNTASRSLAVSQSAAGLPAGSIRSAADSRSESCTPPKPHRPKGQKKGVKGKKRDA